jgi:cell division FtsZ-interacting protein ZapD
MTSSPVPSPERARLEALIEQWRNASMDDGVGYDTSQALNRCADELEAERAQPATGACAECERKDFDLAHLEDVRQFAKARIEELTAQLAAAQAAKEAAEAERDRLRAILRNDFDYVEVRDAQ